MAMVDFFIEKKELSSHIITLPMETDTRFGPYCKNGSIMKSMAMVDFFIENKDTLLVRICKNGSIMKSMAMVDFFIENKGTFFPYHYITYGNRHALVRICENGSIMKSMAMVDFFIKNKGKLQLKQQDIINHTNTRFGPYLQNGSIMKSMAMVDFFIENKKTLFGRICENGSIMKSMAMVDFFIENKGTFFPYHYITYENRHALVRICKNGWLMKSMAMVDFFIENKGTFFPYHYITYGNRHALVQNFLPHHRHYLWKQTLFGRICENGSIMKSMAMVYFFIENKGTFFPYHYITMETDTLWSYMQKWVDNEIHGYMVDFFIENKGKLQLKQQDNINHTKVGKGVNFCVNGNFLPTSLHYLWKQTRFGPYLRKWVDNEIHGYGRLLH
ncbi:hypothetical protein H6P81_021632 [Aristolochia fimbriata]|uniref:LAGLIDADG homing endonuclease n=1 Tax=Aristolochia fimbriata TaxID=158543 RepID=A0AAV7DS17_ARIFI|nr:hypothetical protein H6P81_021632 [Aristolochia fimbriata]